MSMASANAAESGVFVRLVGIRLAVGLVVATASVASGQVTIEAGSDLFSTPGCGQSFKDFSGLLAILCG